MKRKIAILLMTGICLMNTVPCFASQSSMVSVSNSEEAQYTTPPDADTLQKDVGFKPKAPETLAGGYQFNSGNITELFDLDTNGAQINKHKGIDFQYLKKDNNTTKSVSLSAEPASGQHYIHQIIHKLSTYYVEFFCSPYYYFSKVHDK